MATIRKRSGKYSAVVRLRGFAPQYRTFTKLADAKAWARDVESRMERRDFAAGDQTLAMAIERYRASAKGEKLNKAELRILDWWEDRLGDRQLRTLQSEDFEAAQQELRQTRKHGKRRPLPEACQAGKCDCPTLKPSTVNRRLARISAALSYAQKPLKWITENPAQIPALDEDNERSDDVLLPEATFTKLLSACKATNQPHLYPMVRTAMASGARAGELQKLTWADVDLDAGVAILRNTKNGTTRAVPLHGAIEELQALKANRPVPALDGSDRVFLNASGLDGVFNYRRSWAAAKREAGVDDFRFHDLRHYQISTMAKAGVTQQEAMAISGHKTPTMLKRYSHLFDRRLKEIGEKVAAELPAAEKAEQEAE